MEVSITDITIIVLYLVAVALIGSLSGGKQRSTKDYFMGGESVPWWAVAFAIVAAETSSLTFISIPGLAYLTNLNFLQVTIGYLIGRVIVAAFMLPSYRKGELATAYSYLETRFGINTRRYASTVFLLTRVAADGVRLFSTAIPLAIIFKLMPAFSDWTDFNIYMIAIMIITAVSFIYTFTGGVKGVIWADVLQMFIYIGGALLALGVLLNQIDLGVALNRLGDKLDIFNFDMSGGLFSTPYTVIGSLIGGMFLSMASHGTDQLIVQRLLTTRTLRDSQKAIITSGVMVIIQFALFLFVGLLLYIFYDGISIQDAAAPFHKPDEIFPYFIISSLPSGVKGFIIAGLFAAAMSTLAGSISSLSSSVMLDLYRPFKGDSLDPQKELKLSRMLTVFWAVVLCLVAFAFIRLQHSVVEIALGIASITYGGLLGTFLLGLFFKKVKQSAAIAGFTAGILVMGLVVVMPVFGGAALKIHWTWFVLIGTTTTIIIGNIFTAIKR
jgi:SSS family solute:Na+ symporter